MAQASSKLKREFSSGGIVLRLAPLAQDKSSKSKLEVLLIQNASIKDHKINYWGFPKGNIEPGQTSRDAAIREVQEEGGVTAEIVDKIGDAKYVYTRDGNRIFKVVTIYLMKYQSGNPENHDDEVLDAKWFNPEEALKTLSFARDRELLQKALEMLESR